VPTRVREKSEGVRQKFQVVIINAIKYPKIILLGGMWVLFFLLRGARTDKGCEPLIFLIVLCSQNVKEKLNIEAYF